jgi:hypothetical protein
MGPTMSSLSTWLSLKDRTAFLGRTQSGRCMPRESTNSSIGSWSRQWSTQKTSLKPGIGHAIQRVLCVINSQKCWCTFASDAYLQRRLGCSLGIELVRGFSCLNPRMLWYNKIGGWLPCKVTTLAASSNGDMAHVPVPMFHVLGTRTFRSHVIKWYPMFSFSFREHEHGCSGHNSQC